MRARSWGTSSFHPAAESHTGVARGTWWLMLLHVTETFLGSTQGLAHGQQFTSWENNLQMTEGRGLGSLGWVCEGFGLLLTPQSISGGNAALLPDAGAGC